MISIFAKPAFLNVNPSQDFVYSGSPPKRGYLMRVSSMIRGGQIADRIGARVNPREDYGDDVCIYVKPHLKKDNMEFKFEGRKSYIDIVDGHNLGALADKHPEVGVIVCSEVDRETMSGVISNDIFLIPQHHCNFDRVKREISEIKTVGVIGTRDAFQYLPPDLKPELAKRGIALLEYCKFFTREDVVNFYKQIDVQVIWRPYRKLLSNPLKMVNASSFGIPTVALDERAFREMEGCYIPVTNLDEFLTALDSFVESRDMYNEYSQRCTERSEHYHIDNVGKMYKQLDT